MNKDRIEFTTSDLRPSKRPDIYMLQVIIDDLEVVLHTLQSGVGTLTEMQVQRIVASNEWQGMSYMFTDLPTFDNFRTTHWNKLDSEGMPTETIHIPFTHEVIVTYLKDALSHLQDTLSSQDTYNKDTFEKVREIYNSQSFCQIAGPLLSNPQLANEYRKHLQESTKQRKYTK